YAVTARREGDGTRERQGRTPFTAGSPSQPVVLADQGPCRLIAFDPHVGRRRGVHENTYRGVRNGLVVHLEREDLAVVRDRHVEVHDAAAVALMIRSGQSRQRLPRAEQARGRRAAVASRVPDAQRYGEGLSGLRIDARRIALGGIGETIAIEIPSPARRIPT